MLELRLQPEKTELGKGEASACDLPFLNFCGKI
jgi:hypothetical protein